MKTDYYQIEVTTDIFSPSINRGDVVYCSHSLEINNSSFVHCMETDTIMSYGEFKELYPYFESMTLSKVVGVQGGLLA